MDNAVKAMYIAAGTLIALMVISVFVYMFRNGARLGHSYQQSQENLQIVKFNGQFDNYARSVNQQTSEHDGYAFIEKGNTASDVISAANLAMSINKTNEYDEVNSVEVIVVCGGDKYYVSPREDQPKNQFIKNRTRTQGFSDTDTLDFYDFLKMYNEVRIVNIVSTNYSSSHETIYRYYFDVNKDENNNENEGITISEVTGKIDKIVFTLHQISDPVFYNTSVWKDTR